MFYRWEQEALFISCKIIPRSSVDRIAEASGDYLRIKITAAPTDGKGNAHLIRYLSKQFKVRQTNINIVSGQTSNRKVIRIAAPLHLPAGIEKSDK